MALETSNGARAELTEAGASAPPRREGALRPQADARCIADVLAGNRQKFAELIERYQGAVYAVVRGYVRDPHAAEDVAQEVFLKAYTALSTLREPASFFPWLVQIARNAGQAAGRNSRRPDRFPLQDTTVVPEQPETPTHARVSHVLAQVEQLPEPYRSTVLLKYEHNLTCKEIAEQEGVAVSTITSRLARALATLRTALVEQ
jgi:RNA polymerase sigma-70 factor (ECF subfamily)